MGRCSRNICIPIACSLKSLESKFGSMKELLDLESYWKEAWNRIKQRSLVELFLLGRHVDSEDLLHFCRQGFLHIFLDTTQ